MAQQECNVMTTSRAVSVAVTLLAHLDMILAYLAPPKVTYNIQQRFKFDRVCRLHSMGFKPGVFFGEWFPYENAKDTEKELDGSIAHYSHLTQSYQAVRPQSKLRKIELASVPFCPTSLPHSAHSIMPLLNLPLEILREIIDNFVSQFEYNKKFQTSSSVIVLRLVNRQLNHEPALSCA